MTRALKRSRDTAGHVIPGLWEGDIVRMEKIDDLWCFQVPCREIGATGYFEFRPVSVGGKWRTAGYRKTLQGCCLGAEKMQAGETVLRPTSGSGVDRVPAHVLSWSEVSAEIAAHPSVKGA